MFHFKFQLKSLEEYATELSNAMGAEIENGLLPYPGHIAKGYSLFMHINDFISIQISRYIAADKIIFERIPSAGNNMTITVLDFTFAKCPVHGYDCNEIMANNNSIGSIQCKSTAIAETVIINEGVGINVLTIFFKENWENNILKDAAARETLKKYLIHENANLRKEFLSAEQNGFFKEIMEGCNRTALHLLFYQSRIFALLESFFEDILNEDERDQSLFASGNDVAMVQNAEAYLSSHLTEPFPGVDMLAKMCLMSRTKFINLFNKIYNISSYEYYQKKRLSKAYNMLRPATSLYMI